MGTPQYTPRPSKVAILENVGSLEKREGVGGVVKVTLIDGLGWGFGKRPGLPVEPPARKTGIFCCQERPTIRFSGLYYIHLLYYIYYIYVYLLYYMF